MATTNQQIDAAVPLVGPSTADANKATMRLLNAILRSIRDSAEAGSGGDWGQIGGNIDDQVDLIARLAQKFDLPSGNINQYVRGDGALASFPNLVPVATSGDYNDLINRPDLSSLDGIETAADFASLPPTGDSGKLYITQDNGTMYRWNGSQYVDVSTSLATWGGIQGTLTNQTDLKNALNGKLNKPLGSASDYLDGQGNVKAFPAIPEDVSELNNDAGYITAAMSWGTISANITLKEADNGKAFLITNDCTIAIDSGLSAGWNIALVPDDDPHETSHTISLVFNGGGSAIGGVSTIKGAASVALTPTANLFSVVGAVE